MFDKSFFTNPFYEYIKWLAGKIFYQIKYRKGKLRIGYLSFVRNTSFGCYNWIGNHNLITNCEINDYSYIAGNCVLNNTQIGKFCSIAPNVRTAPGKHPTNTFVSTHPITFAMPNFMVRNYLDEEVFKSNGSVVVGNDVWIGANCLIIEGVNISDGAIIAANSVVTKNVGPYEIWGGVAAKLIKRRFTDDEIRKLLIIKWWDKDEEWLHENIKYFVDVEKFVNLFKGF